MVGKIELRGPGPLVVNTVINYCCTRVVLYAKMLKETEIQEKKAQETRLFCDIFMIGGISIKGAGRPPAPLRLDLCFGRPKFSPVSDSTCSILENDGF